MPESYRSPGCAKDEFHWFHVCAATVDDVAVGREDDFLWFHDPTAPDTNAAFGTGD